MIEVVAVYTLYVYCQRCGRKVQTSTTQRKYCEACQWQVKKETNTHSVRKAVEIYRKTILRNTCTDCGRVFYSHRYTERCIDCENRVEPNTDITLYCTADGGELRYCRECGGVFAPEKDERECELCQGLEKEPIVAPSRRKKRKRPEPPQNPTTPMEKELARLARQNVPNIEIREIMVHAKYEGYGISYGKYVADHGYFGTATPTTDGGEQNADE